jgi:hypothetical protein
MWKMACTNQRIKEGNATENETAEVNIVLSVKTATNPLIGLCIISVLTYVLPSITTNFYADATCFGRVDHPQILKCIFTCVFIMLYFNA